MPEEAAVQAALRQSEMLLVDLHFLWPGHDYQEVTMSKGKGLRYCTKRICLCYGRCCPVDDPRKHCGNHYHECHQQCGEK